MHMLTIFTDRYIKASLHVCICICSRYKYLLYLFYVGFIGAFIYTALHVYLYVMFNWCIGPVLLVQLSCYIYLHALLSAKFIVYFFCILHKYVVSSPDQPTALVTFCERKENIHCAVQCAYKRQYKQDVMVCVYTTVNPIVFFFQFGFMFAKFI